MVFIIPSSSRHHNSELLRAPWRFTTIPTMAIDSLSFAFDIFFFPTAMLDGVTLAGRRGTEASIHEHTAKRFRSLSARYDAY